jgi:DUF971 family protein
MLLGMSQVDLAILLPAFAAAWNLVGGETLFADQKASGRVCHSRDGLISIEAPAGWEHHTQEGTNELTFLNGKVSVSVSTAETHAGDTIDQFLEFTKSLLRYMCPAAEVCAEGQTTVAGAPGSQFTMFCPGPRERTIVRVAVTQIRNKFYILKIATPSAELHAVQATIDRMAQSFRASDELPAGREPRRRAC